MTDGQHKAWSARHRNQLLESWAELRARLREADGSERRDRLLDSIANLREDYRAGLPQRAMGRCPHSGALFSHSIDDVGLDGEWWHYDAPVRRLERPPSTFFGLVGAVRLTGDIPDTDWLVKPGPEVPFVMPWILEHPAMAAVVASLPIGEHTGYAITYFASTRPEDLSGVNTWGAHEFAVYGPDGATGWDSRPSREPLFDYELAPWIESGKLRWIAPGDETFALRDAVDGCPYLGLEGERGVSRIERGEVWR